MVVIARDEDEPYVTGDEGIGDRRDGPAFEIGVEDRKIEVGFPRRFQRLVNARCPRPSCGARMPMAASGGYRVSYGVGGLRSNHRANVAEVPVAVLE